MGSVHHYKKLKINLELYLTCKICENAKASVFKELSSCAILTKQNVSRSSY